MKVVQDHPVPLEQLQNWEHQNGTGIGEALMSMYAQSKLTVVAHVHSSVS